MQLSRTRVSGKNALAKVFLASLLSLMGLTVFGVSQAGAVATAVNGMVLNGASCSGAVTTGLSGSANGSQAISVCGTNFGTRNNTVTQVYFGTSTNLADDAQSPTVLVNTPSALEAVVPFALANAGKVSVIVDNAGAVSPLTCGGTGGATACQYTYTFSAPAVTSISPSQGSAAGGNTVTIQGTNIAGATAVDFGSTPATSFAVNSTAPGSGIAQITAVVPPGTGTANITVTTPGGTSPTTVADVYTFLSTPTVTGIRTLTNPAGGPTGGGTQVLVDGTGFTSDSVVSFGGTVATSTLVNSLDSITAVAPAGAAGTVDVTVHNAQGTSGSTSADDYTYDATPGIADGTASYSTSTAVTQTTQPANPVDSFNASTLVTGGTTFDPSTLSVVTQPTSGTLTFSGSEINYAPNGTWSSAVNSKGATVWTFATTSSAPDSATLKMCVSPGTGCLQFTMTYLVAQSGFYMGNELSASGNTVAVVEDTGAGVSVSDTTPAPNGTFTTVTAPTMAYIPATNSGFNVTSVGGYNSITPVPSGLSLVPGSLMVVGGDSQSSGKYTVSYCTAAMGYVAGQCTANFTGNFKATYPYIETALNPADSIPGGNELTLPSITAQWSVNSGVTPGTNIGLVETEFAVTTSVVGLGDLYLDAYPTNLASYDNQGPDSNPPSLLPVYTAPTARWTVTVRSAGPPPTITSVTPDVGPTSGGTGVAIKGTNLTGAPVSVTIGGNAATITNDTAGEIDVTTPASTGPLAHGGVADVVVSTTNGSVTDTGGFTYQQAPTITTASLANLTVGTASTDTVAATGFPAPTFAASGTALPTGITLDTTTGALTGTPAAGTGGSYSGIVITASNGVSPDAVKTYSLTVDEAPTITTASLADLTVGTASTDTVAATGFPAPTFAASGTALPTGITLNPTTGALTGTPAAGTGRSYSGIIITASNGIGSPSVQTYTLVVDEAPSITSAATTTFGANQTGSFTVTATGYPGPTFTETGALPGTVTLNATTGVLSGNPGATLTSYPITITAHNSVTTSTQSFTLVVSAALTAPVITTSSLPDLTVGSASSDAVTATGVPAPTFTEAGALPVGVTFNSDGSFTGTPAADSGRQYPGIQVTATNSQGHDTVTFTLTVNEAPSITTASLANLTVGTASTDTVAATGFPAPTFAASGTALPTGVTLNPTTGALTGTPAAGTGRSYSGIIITASNGIGTPSVQTYTLTVNEAPSITTASLANLTVGTASTDTVAATGFPAPTFAASGTALPTGITLNPTTGALTGTPAAGTGRSYSGIVITASNGIGTPSAKTFTLTVDEAPSITTASLANLTVGRASTDTVAATGFPAPTFTASGTALPTGITLNPTTGALTGTPAAGTAGVHAGIIITASNGIGSPSAKTYSLTVDEAPAITSADSATFTNGEAGSFQVTATGYPAPTFTETGALPTGVTLDLNSGVLSGTPSSTGVFDITLIAGNGIGAEATQSFTLTVPGPPTAPSITGVTVGDATATVAWTPAGDGGGGPVTGYTVTSSPGGLTCTSSTTSCTVNGLTNGTAYTFTVTATNAIGTGPASAPSAPETPSADVAIPGYWMATSAGGILTNGAAVSYGSPAGLALDAPIVAVTPTPDRKGYWMVAADGGVFAYGDATFYGSTGGMHLNAPIVGIASTSDGRGYWMVAADGGVFAYGDAGFAGSTGGKHLNAPIVGITGNGTGGYWMVAADGGVFAFGSAPFHGSAGDIALASPVVGIAALANGSGYYIVGADGGVFAYGAAPFRGSASGSANSPVVGITNGAGGGYTLVTKAGGAYSYGTGFYGSQAGTPTSAPIISIAS